MPTVIEGVEYLDADEWREMAERVCQYRMGMSVAEFRMKYEAGGFDADELSSTPVMMCRMMMESLE